MSELDSFLAWIEEGEKNAAKNKNFIGSLVYALFKGMLKRTIEEYRKVEEKWVKT